MKRRRVKITGIGPVTPAGVGREAFWRGILEPVSRVRPFTQLGEEYGPLVAAYLDAFNVSDYLDRSLLPKGFSRQTAFATAGAMLALQDAGLTRADLENTHCAIVTGSSLMDFGSIGAAIEGVQKRGPRGAQPRALYGMGISSVPSSINQALRLSARTMAVSTQCSAGMDAIGYAADLVATGEAEIALCGGAEAPLHRFPLLELRAAELTPASTEMPERLARPFDLWRTTGVVSEGASMFVLEPESSPRAGYSYISGYAFATDEANDICSGMVTSGKLAAAAARRRPSEIEAIFAWAPGHKQIDEGEARAMLRLIGPALSEIPVVSIQGAIGTTLGATPAIQVAATCLAQRESVLPPTVNWKHPDPMCPVNLSERSRHLDHSLTLINAHGAGGVNASLILERC